jgi:outer membrane protein TolC
VARAQTQLSLADAVARALEHNPELAIDIPAQAAAREEYRASRAGYYPRLDFEQSYMGGNNPVFVFGTLLSQRRFTEQNFAIEALNRPDPIGNLISRFSAQQTIWDFGRTQNQSEVAKISMELADRSAEDHRRQVLLAVLDAYLSVSLAQEGLEASHKAVASAEAIVGQAMSRVDSGLAVEADLLRSKTLLSRAQQREIEARGALELARAHLNRIMGSPLDSPIGETAKLAPILLDLPDEEALLQQQRQHRPDYQKLLAQVRQAELQTRSRKSALYPMLGAFGSWEANNISLTRAGGTNWTAGVSLKWNLYGGGRESASLRAARQRLEQQRKQLAAMESAMALEIRSAVINTHTSERQVQVARAAEAQSEESLRILRNRYDAGLATMTDLLSAETARASSRTSLAEAIYRHRLSYAQLEFAGGILSPTSKAMHP